MATQKQYTPFFATILSVLSIVFYCAGFLRVEVELNEQKKRINALENVAETGPPSSEVHSDAIITNIPQRKFVFNSALVCFYVVKLTTS